MAAPKEVRLPQMGVCVGLFALEIWSQVSA